MADCKENSLATNKIYHAHDRSAKFGLQDIRVARDFFKHHLPEKIQQLIKLGTLKIEDGAFIDLELKSFETDVLYSVGLVDAADDEIAYIFLHVEHLSAGDPTISFRIVQYAVKIIDRHLKNYSTQKLPLIIPLVLYNGEKPFSEPLSIFELFGEQEALARQYMFNTFHLVDLNTISDEEIRCHQWASLMEMILKHIHSRQIMTVLETMTDLFQQFVEQQAEEYTIAMLKYIIEKSSMEDRQKFLNWVRKNLPQKLRKDTMTLAEQWKNEGMELGIQQGMKNAMTLAEQWKNEGMELGVRQGLEQGTLAGEKTLLKRQLTRRFGQLSDIYIEKIDRADSNQLLEWGDRILVSTSLQEIFDNYY